MTTYLKLQWGYGPGLLMCSTCFALVLAAYGDDHEMWHQEQEERTYLVNEDDEED